MLRSVRRTESHKWRHLTVYTSPEGQLHVYSDFGRILVPMIIVHYDENGYPYTKFNEETRDYILSGQGSIDWYLEQQILEYVSVEESHNCLVADSPESFLRNTQPELYDVPDTRYKYTHIIIPQSMLGLVALLSPFANHA